MWRVEFDRRAVKDLDRLGAKEKERIRRFIDERLVRAADPRLIGSALSGNLAGLWRYRIGDIRLIVRIVDDRLTVLVVGIGHRSEVYR